MGEIWDGILGGIFVLGFLWYRSKFPSERREFRLFPSLMDILLFRWLFK